MNNNPIASSLAEQFTRAWKIWREAVQNIPDEEWKTGAIETLVPVRQTYHAVMAAEFYISKLPPDQYIKISRYKLDWPDRVEEMPDKKDLLADIDWIESETKKWLDELGDSGLMEQETLLPWTGARVLDKAIYYIRHLHHHLGELQAEMIYRDIPRAEWKG